LIGHFPVADVSPVVFFGGEFFPVKAIPGESIAIAATVIHEGHAYFGVEAILIDEVGQEIDRVTLREKWAGSDHYEGSFIAPALGDYTFCFEVFNDPFLTWQHDCEIKISANIDPELCCEIGALIFEEKLAQDMTAWNLLQPIITSLRNTSLAPANRFSIASTAQIREYFVQHPLRKMATKSAPYPLGVDRDRALIGAWYEFFPRSEGATKESSGTFVTAVQRLSDIAAMGFDVIYLPPIHPIGRTYRKGANNSASVGPRDPGVPWAIGSKDGGHDAINPELGTMADFENFVSAAARVGLEVALDLALQTSPEHPWVKEHPAWFIHRPDGTIAYAENPPKKYQDIYPLNFDQDYAGLLQEVLRIIRLWISKGVRLFRVDNPHTKPIQFWCEVLAIIHKEFPQIIFLAEAFTRPAMMHALGKVGFHQSYTYFTWRTTKLEITAYGHELADKTSAYFRPNFWVNTPDILPLHLQGGNPAMFALRAVLASTLSPSWGMYAGYELFEHLPLKEGGEEYLDSEKYQIRIRDWAGAKKNGLTLAPFITQLNQIRRLNPALQRLRNLAFHSTDSDAIIAYSKREGSNLILVIVNLDPTFAQETTVHWNMDALGISHTSFSATDLLDESKFTWSAHTFIRLDPSRPTGKVAHIVQVELN
jgi:starch synthase (maltosyl-transferring)